MTGKRGFWLRFGIVAAMALVVGSPTRLRAVDQPLPGMTHAASSDIVVQTCRDQTYTLKIARKLESLRREFSRRFQAPMSSARFETILFKDRAAYKAYLEGRKISGYPARGAYFPEQRSVFLYFEGTPEEVLERNLVHEVVHHFNRAVYGNTPTWLDEGMAMYFQETDFSRAPVGLGAIDPDVAANVKRALERKRLPRVSALLGMDYKAFHVADEALERLHYDVSWALVHFFVHGAEKLKPADANSRRRVSSYLPKFLLFLKQMRKTRTKPEISWQKTMSDIQVETFEKDFHQYLKLLPDESPSLVEKWPNGKKKFEGEMRDGQFNGPVTYWYENGQMRCRGTMRNGKWHGTVSFWAENGKPMGVVEYRDGQQVEE